MQILKVRLFECIKRLKIFYANKKNNTIIWLININNITWYNALCASSCLYYVDNCVDKSVCLWITCENIGLVFCHVT